MSKQPWMKFYPSDWRADPKLRRCSLAARGLWIEMLGVMHEAEPRGHLVSNGDILGVDDLAALVGADAATVETLLDELEARGVFSRKKNGAIYSRRMESDEKNARIRRENGKKGGNPTLCKHTQKDGLDNQRDKPQKPEARSQKPEEENTHQRHTVPLREADADDAGRLAVKQAVAKAMGFDWRDARLRLDFGRVDQWLADGLDLALITETVERVMAKRNGSPPASLAYFDMALAEAKAQRSAPMPKATAKLRRIGPNDPIITEHGKPDAFGRKLGQPGYGSRWAI